MTRFDPCLSAPSLGNPRFVVRSSPGGETLFSIVLAGSSPDLEVRPLLDGNLFLQCLRDTREVVQARATVPAEGFKSREEIVAKWSALWDVQHWPQAVMDRLIPLEVVDVKPAAESPWKAFTPSAAASAAVYNLKTESDPQGTLRWFPHQELIDRDYAYSVTVKIPRTYVASIQAPQLFNLIHNHSAEGFCDVSFHSVYIHDDDWKRFMFVHATDSHIAWRNDFIQEIVRQAMGEASAVDFINYNERFRQFIKRANELHRRNQCDLILLTGDLVDFIHCPRFIDDDAALKGNGRSFTSPGLAIPQDHFELLSNIVAGWPKYPGAVVGEELEVPLFTVPGNHDYRFWPYPLICTYQAWVFFANYNYTKPQYEEFGLTKEEANAYETGSPDGMRYCGANIGVDAQAALDHVSHEYRARLNADTDFAIELGGDRIICLASGADYRAFTSLQDMIQYDIGLQAPDQARDDFAHNTSHGTGFTQAQIDFVKRHVDSTKGTAVIACHNPLFDFRLIPPPPSFRETEHGALDQAGRRQEFVDSLKESFKKGAFTHDYPESEFDAWAAATGWSLQCTPYFKKGDRDPDLSNGAPDKNFKQIMQIICRKGDSGGSVQLLLAGHTHRSLEFRAKLEDSKIAFFHDYYVDGTMNGHLPSDYWGAEHSEYSDPLSRTLEAKEWWKRHAPLFVQTVSLTAPPGGEIKWWDVGFLLITVEGGVITRISRECQLRPIADQAYFVLFSSPA